MQGGLKYLNVWGGYLPKPYWQFNSDIEPRGSIYGTIMELGPKRPSLLWFWDPNSIVGLFMDLLGKPKYLPLLFLLDS